MSSSNRFSDFLTDTWVYALLGGLVSLTLSVGIYISSNSISISEGLVVGGLIAGYFAQRNGATADSLPIGIRAGIIGSIPAVVFIGMLIEPVSGPTWFSILSTAGVAIGHLGLIIVVSAMVGGLNSFVGWKLALTISENNTVSTT